MIEDECVGHINKSGKNKGKLSCNNHFARKYLIERDGPPPFEGAVCRHLCENDSMHPNGFVCVKHTVWGTCSENFMDRKDEVKTKISSNGGKIGGKKSGNYEYTCPHCGLTSRGNAFRRWHFDNCKHKI